MWDAIGLTIPQPEALDVIVTTSFLPRNFGKNSGDQKMGRAVGLVKKDSVTTLGRMTNHLSPKGPGAELMDQSPQ